MAVYLYNLGFSLANATNGNFLDYQGSQTGFGQSSTWFQWNVQGSLPQGVVDNVASLQALTLSNWTKMSSAPDFCANADYMLLRIFNVDTPQPSISLRVTAVMGHGIPTNGAPASSPLQAPFQINGKARPVVDIDNSNGANWPGPTGADGAWTYCLGMIHGIINDYSCNVGASAYVSSGTYVGTSCFGQDPQLHVGSTQVPACDDEDDESAA
jgi:hypothetical protein